MFIQVLIAICLMRGFTHKSAEGEWFLTDQPTLKSCCQSSPSMSEVVFLITDDPIEEKRLYTFEGTVVHEGGKTTLVGKKVDVGEKPFTMIIAVGALALLISFFAVQRLGKAKAPQ